MTVYESTDVESNIRYIQSLFKFIVKIAETQDIADRAVEKLCHSDYIFKRRQIFVLSYGTQ